LIQTECGAAPAWPSRPLAPIAGHLGIEASVFVKVPAAVKGLSELFTSTGAYHYAFLLGTNGAPQLGAHDIGRHTAVDKVIGKALLAGKGFGELALYTTGRISSDVASKCVRAGIPVVVSRGAPLTRAVELARSNNLGMVGFLRGGRFNVYAGEEHIIWD
jgi:FdhD protein